MNARAAACLTILVSLAACAAPRPQLRDEDYPGELLAPAAFGADVLWQQRVTALWGDGEQRGFDAAVQKRGDVLTIVALSPVGQPGFVVVVKDGAVTLTNHTDMQVPFPPRFVVLDVQRVFATWLPTPSATERSDGALETSGVAGGERIVETWRDGRLRERTFTRVDGVPAGTITVRYDWTGVPATQRAPVRAELDNAWFGYRIVIDTHTEAALPPPGS